MSTSQRPDPESNVDNPTITIDGLSVPEPHLHKFAEWERRSLAYRNYLLLWDVERNTRAMLDELRKLNRFLDRVSKSPWIPK